MKIAVDGYELSERFTGVGRVISNLLPGLSLKFPSLTFWILTDKKIPEFASENVQTILLPHRKGYTAWQNGPFYRKLRSLQPDLLIAFNYTLPVLSKWRSILYEHDVSFAAHPEWFGWADAKKRNLLVKRSIRKADTIVTVSEFSRSEIMRFFHPDPKKVKVLYHGLESQFRNSSSSEIQAWKKKKGLEGKRVIGFLGSIFNRRHIPALIEAVRFLRKDIPDLFLHMIGEDLTHPPQNISIKSRSDWILWETSISDDDLPVFYSSLEGFAYLSEYEGFGLPPLEALACGTVPILLNKTALKEIYTGMAVMIEEPDVHLIRDSLQNLLSDPGQKQEILKRYEKEKSRFSIQRFVDGFSEILLPFMKENA